jgi:hypothetical protein
MWTGLSLVAGWVVLMALDARGRHLPGPGERLDLDSPGLAIALFFGSFVVAFGAYWYPRRRQPRPFVLLAGSGLAVTTLLLGLASYWGCHGVQSVVGTATHQALALFAGNVAEPFGSGSSCPSAMPPALEIARLTGILTTVAGAAAALLAILGDQVDRLAARVARRLILVSGLDAASLPLLEALTSTRPGHTVVAVSPTLSPEVVTRARTAGARVLAGDLADGRTLRSVRRGGAMREAYLLSPDASTNTRIARMIVDQHRTPSVPTGSGPIVVVRIDDPWQAEDWRRSQIGTTRDVLVDTIGIHQVTAQEIVDRAVARGSDCLVVVGSDLMALAVLDEVAAHKREQSVYKSPVRLDTVVVDPDARTLVADHGTHQRWFGNDATAVTSHDVAVEDMDWAALLEGRARPLVVDTRPAGSTHLRWAQRLSTAHPESLVLVRDETTGVSGSALLSNLVTYGPALRTLRGVPESSWTRLARRLHESYLAAHAPDLRPGTRPWSELDDFYRLSNVRSIQVVLVEAVRAGFAWFPSNDESSPVEIAPEEIAQIARAEHTSWLSFYRRAGWRPGARDDERRRNPFVVPWDQLPEVDPPHGQERALEQVRTVLAHLAGLGYRPFPAAESLERRGASRYHRVGEVTATRLDQSTSWQTATGDVMRAPAGDWLLTDHPEGGASWTITDEAFRRTYRHVRGTVYVRAGDVLAAQARRREVLATTEGRATVQPGDWILEDEHGHQWSQGDADFRKRYVEAVSAGPTNTSEGSR